MKSSLQFAVFAIVSTSTAFAQLSSMRATIPGSLHECEQTTLFLFDTGNARPITITLLPSSRSPTDRDTMTLKEAISIGPLQLLNEIKTPDAQAYDWKVSIAAGEKFETWGFFPDGNGKNLNLPRTVMSSLPSDEGKCAAATAEGSKPGPGIKKATTGRIYVGKAMPAIVANATEPITASSDGPPGTAVQAVASATSASTIASSSVTQPQASTTSSTAGEGTPSSSVSAMSDKSTADDSKNSASGQVIMKWLVGGLGVVASGLLL
ncbi:hypothetical protein JCM16303_005210 [Sporobolomyces ruberrimus]